jgi:membrane protease YdiL (CAAX protease family)
MMKWYGRPMQPVNVISPVSAVAAQRRTFPGALEALLEISGTTLAAGALMGLLGGLPLMGARVFNLPAGFGLRGTPGFALALLLGSVLIPMTWRRIFDGWPPRQLAGQARLPVLDSLRAGLLVAAGLTLWSQFLMWVAPEILLPAWRSFGISEPAQMWVAILYVTPFTAALPEEFFFRGYIQGTLNQRLGRPWAVLMVAGAFSLAHLDQGLPAVFLAVLPAALALGLLYERTGTILAPLLAHATINALSFLQFGSLVFYPDWGNAIITGVTLGCLALLLAARQSLRQPLGDALELRADLIRDRTGLLLALTTVPVTLAIVVVTLGLVSPLAADDPDSSLPLLVAAGLLWAAALVIHSRRGAPWGSTR